MLMPGLLYLPCVPQAEPACEAYRVINLANTSQVVMHDEMTPMLHDRVVYEHTPLHSVCTRTGQAEICTAMAGGSGTGHEQLGLQELGHG